MPAILTDPPERGTYAHVVFRGDRYLQEHAIALICYDGHFDSRWIEWTLTRDDRVAGQPEGSRVHMLFLKTPEQRDVATKRGWLDITDAWFAELDASVIEPSDVEAVVRALASPRTPSALAKATEIPLARVERILASLKEAGSATHRGAGAVVIWSLSAPAPAKPADPVEATA